MASGPFQPLHPMSQGHLFSVIHFFGKVSFPICSPWALVPALKIYEGCTGTSFQLLLFFFLRISKISRQIKAFSIWYVQMLLLFQVCFFLLLAGEWKDVCLSLLGGGTLLIKAKIDCAGSGCFEAQCPSGSFISHWHTGLVQLLGFIFSLSAPLSPWQSTVALNRRYMTCENKWWTAAWALGLGPSEQVRRGLCMSGKSHFWAPGLVLREESSVPTQRFLFN